MKNRGDPGAFTILFTVRSSRFSRALCDLGARINLIPLEMFKNLGLRPPKPIMIWLLIVDYVVKKPMDISFDVLVKEDNLVFWADFVVRDYEVDFEMPKIFKGLFFVAGREFMDMEIG